MHIDVETVRWALDRRPHVPASRRAGDRLAAVAAVLRDRDGEAEVLLIRRAEHDGDPWSGHMAFPGGRHDADDPDLLHTAVRETHEEVGLTLEPTAHCIGRLDDLPAIAQGRRVGLIIAPFVFHARSADALIPDGREVTETVWAPLSPMARGERDTSYPYAIDGRVHHLPGYDVGGRVVWGLTHRMLTALFEAVT